MDNILSRISKCKKWLHKNGRIYEVMHIANIDAKETERDEYPLMIVYKDDNGVVWSKTPEAFIRSRIEYDNTKI